MHLGSGSEMAGALAFAFGMFGFGFDFWKTSIFGKSHADSIANIVSRSGANVATRTGALCITR